MNTHICRARKSVPKVYRNMKISLTHSMHDMSKQTCYKSVHVEMVTSSKIIIITMSPKQTKYEDAAHYKDLSLFPLSQLTHKVHETGLHN